MGAATSVCVCVCVPAGKSSALFLFSMLITHCPAEQHSVRVWMYMYVCMSWHTPQADAQLPLGQSSFTAFASNKPSSSTPAPAPSPPLSSPPQDDRH